MRFLSDQHPLLLATGLYLWLLYNAVTTIWGDAAEREYEWREKWIHSWLPRGPFDGEGTFVFARKAVAWVFLVVGSFTYVAYMHWKLGASSLLSP